MVVSVQMEVIIEALIVMPFQDLERPAAQYLSQTKYQFIIGQAIIVKIKEFVLKE